MIQNQGLSCGSVGYYNHFQLFSFISVFCRFRLSSSSDLSDFFFISPLQSLSQRISIKDAALIRIVWLYQRNNQKP